MTTKPTEDNSDVNHLSDQQGVPNSTAAYITIMGGKLFKKVAAAAAATQIKKTMCLEHMTEMSSSYMAEWT